MRSESEVRERVRRRGAELRRLVRGTRSALDIAVFTLGGAIIDAQVKELEWVLESGEVVQGDEHNSDGD